MGSFDEALAEIKKGEKYISVSADINAEDAARLESALLANKQVTSLNFWGEDLDNAGIISIAEHCKNLQSVLIYRSPFSESTLTEFFEKVSAQTIDIRNGGRSLTQDAVDALSQNPNLKKVQLEEFDLDEELLTGLLSNPKLNKLGIPRRSEITLTPEVINAITQHENLEELTIEANEFTEELVKPLFENRRQKKINLSGCCDFYDVGFRVDHSWNNDELTIEVGQFSKIARLVGDTKISKLICHESIDISLEEAKNLKNTFPDLKEMQLRWQGRNKSGLIALMHAPIQLTSASIIWMDEEEAKPYLALNELLHTEGSSAPAYRSAMATLYLELIAQNDDFNQEMCMACIEVIDLSDESVQKVVDTLTESEENSHANFVLGYIYATGLGVPRDDEKAKNFFAATSYRCPMEKFFIRYYDSSVSLKRFTDDLGIHDPNLIFWLGELYENSSTLEGNEDHKALAEKCYLALLPTELSETAIERLETLKPSDRHHQFQLAEHYNFHENPKGLQWWKKALKQKDRDAESQYRKIVGQYYKNSDPELYPSIEALSDQTTVALPDGSSYDSPALVHKVLALLKKTREENNSAPAGDRALLPLKQYTINESIDHTGLLLSSGYDENRVSEEAILSRMQRRDAEFEQNEENLKKADYLAEYDAKRTDLRETIIKRAHSDIDFAEHESHSDWFDPAKLAQPDYEIDASDLSVIPAYSALEDSPSAFELTGRKINLQETSSRTDYDKTRSDAALVQKNAEKRQRQLETGKERFTPEQWDSEKARYQPLNTEDLIAADKDDHPEQTTPGRCGHDLLAEALPEEVEDSETLETMLRRYKESYWHDEDALPWLRYLSKQGNSTAAFEAGQALEKTEGYGCEEAILHYKRSAVLGNPNAIRALQRLGISFKPELRGAESEKLVGMVKTLPAAVAAGEIDKEVSEDLQAFAKHTVLVNAEYRASAAALKTIAEEQSLVNQIVDEKWALSNMDLRKLKQFEMLLDRELNHLFIRCLAIANGLADAPVGKAKKVASALNMIGGLIPVPGAATFVEFCTFSAVKFAQAKEKYRAGHLSHSIASSIHHASHLIKAITHLLVIRHQRHIVRISSESAAIFAHALVERIYQWSNQAKEDNYRSMIQAILPSLTSGILKAIGVDNLNLELPVVEETIEHEVDTGKLDEALTKAMKLEKEPPEAENKTMRELALELVIGTALLEKTVLSKAKKTLAKVFGKKVLPGTNQRLRFEAENGSGTFYCLTDEVCMKAGLFVLDGDNFRTYYKVDAPKGNDILGPIYSTETEAEHRKYETGITLETSQWYMLYQRGRSEKELLLEKIDRLREDLAATKKELVTLKSKKMTPEETSKDTTSFFGKRLTTPDKNTAMPPQSPPKETNPDQDSAKATKQPAATSSPTASRGFMAKGHGREPASKESQKSPSNVSKLRALFQ